MKDIKEQIKNAKIVLRDIDDLIPYAKNSRKHSAEQIDKIAASIKAFGFTNPILIKSDGEVIAGHCRLAAAQKLKLKEVPCIELEHLTDIEARAYVIADNKLAMFSEWDDEMLQLELTDLKESEFDLDLIGFGDVENFEFEPPNEDEKDPVKDLTLRITFQDEEEQQALFCELRDRGFKVKT